MPKQQASHSFSVFGHEPDRGRASKQLHEYVCLLQAKIVKYRQHIEAESIRVQWRGTATGEPSISEVEHDQPMVKRKFPKPRVKSRTRSDRWEGWGDGWAAIKQRCTFSKDAIRDAHAVPALRVADDWSFFHQ